MISFSRFDRTWLGALTIAIAFLLVLPLSAMGQDDGSPTPTGTLVIHTYVCVQGDLAPGSVTVQPSGNLGDLDCAPGDTHTLDIDGDAYEAADGSAIDLPVGDHTVTETASGAQLVVSIAEGGTTEIDIVTAAAPEPTETPAATDTPQPTQTPVPTATQPPAKNQITIVMHLCPSSISSRAAFEAIEGFGQELITCPSIVLPENAPAPGGATNGRVSFTLTVEGADLVGETLTPEMFDQRLFCEADAKRDINNNPNDNVCLDLSAYVVQNVKQGNPVTIRPTTLPAGTIYVGRAFDPESNDGDTFLSAGAGGTIKLNTSANGDVTIHYFVAPQPPTATPRPPTSTPVPPTATPKPPTNTPKPATATRTPRPDASSTVDATSTASPNETGTSPAATSTPIPTYTPGGATGSLHLFMRQCFTDLASRGQINALAPGVAPSQSDYGDGTCTYGAGTLIITGPDGSTRQVDVPEIGNKRVNDLSAGTWSVRDSVSGGSGTFTIQADTITNVLSLYYKSDALVEDPAFVPGPGDVDNPTEDANSPDDPNYTPVDEDDVPYFGTEAGPNGGNPFVVDDDPEAVANVAAIAGYDDLPGVGTGESQMQSEDKPSMGLIALALVALGMAIGGIYIRRKQDRE